MFLVDTNVLLHSANTEDEHYAPCHALVESLREDAIPWYSTWPIFNEFLRVATHPVVLPRPWNLTTAWRFLDSLLASPSLTLLRPGDRHPEVVGKTFGEHPDLRGNILHDAHTAILMREHGIRQIYTRDKAFRHFPFLEVIDPVEPRRRR